MRFQEFDKMHFGEYVNKKIPLCDETQKSIKFQIPRMYMPFGITAFVPKSGPTKWNIDFAMKGWEEEGGYIQKFYEFLKRIENDVIEHVYEKRGEIFNNDLLTLEEVRSMFNSTLNEPANGYEPKFRVKVDTYPDSRLKFKVFDRNKEDITQVATDNLYSRNSGIAVVELKYVYFMNRMFGLVWSVNQLQVFEPQRLQEFQIVMPTPCEP